MGPGGPFDGSGRAIGGCLRSSGFSLSSFRATAPRAAGGARTGPGHRPGLHRPSPRGRGRPRHPSRGEGRALRAGRRGDRRALGAVRGPGHGRCGPGVGRGDGRRGSGPDLSRGPRQSSTASRAPWPPTCCSGSPGRWPTSSWASWLPGPSPAPVPEAAERHDFVYFSFVTLTTVGYGDVTPVHPVARSLAVAEALIGQLYPAILLARLVSLATGSERADPGPG